MNSYPFQARSYAKINLFLRVLGRRKDGYHQLESLMAPVSLYDDLAFATGPEFTYEGPQWLNNCENLIYRAWELLQKHYGIGGLRVAHRKNIPAGGGMGGGSSNAAATLSAAAQLYRLNLGYRELAPLALQLGADVPFFLRCTPALARGVGEDLMDVPLPPQHVVLINPGYGVSTPAVYRNLGLSMGAQVAKPGNFEVSDEDLWKLSHLVELCYNDLEIGARPLMPDLDVMREALLQNGALCSRLSGSGSTVFGLYADRESAQQARELIASALPEASVYAVQTLPPLTEAHAGV
ncbi:4-(cytidine 5'-diphospho)-2-C-methyl-D-erythritol kinase [Desulfurispira natronophila]|uniref:4-diphosphocytidyl-2-C-methyl-D-erythritol kinase n=1 Tax=Desulfurispira natronophila TaxID=682562 RepID=A0A7W8DFU8_9BACT|nr:4-(cytidine 5'-diphospho)-2-C-methyl-D-erythritol kinase [Desulfurispira natronophila]MBB5020714.1 4-diphosphocytidyl-2-C-methyl-D-erythritol kinase [Desulfurispira natronophila]